VGLYRERGFGTVWVNPPMLMVKRPIDGTLTDVEAGSVVVPTSVDVPIGGSLTKEEEALVQSVQARASEIRNVKAIAEAARTIADSLSNAARNAVTRGESVPATNQWMRLADEALAAGDLATLESRLPDLIDGARNEDWKVVRGRLRQILRDRPPPIATAPDAVLLKALAGAARDVARKMRRAA
jgi:stage V sporulation protein SpoVS